MLFRAIVEFIVSWENGTESMAIVDWDYSYLSVFHPGSYPLPSGLSSNSISMVVDIAQTTMQNKPPSSYPAATLLEDGAAGDPASLGLAILLANFTVGNAPSFSGTGYGTAADQEVQYLLTSAPRVSSNS